MQRSVNVSLYLTPEERDRLHEVADADDLSLNQFVRRVLRPWLHPPEETPEPAGAR